MPSLGLRWFLLVVSIYVPLPPLYTKGVGLLVGYKVGVIVGLQGMSSSRIT